MTSLNDLLELRRPWVVAHRGDSGRHPENTMGAFEAAITAGADMVEMDVQLSKDRVPVVIHDATLERTTNGHGLVAEHTMNELSRLDAGSWKSPAFASERISSLEEVLESLSGRILLNLELKRNAYDKNPKKDGIEAQVCDIANRFGASYSTMISSFRYSYFSRITKHPHSLPVALLQTHPPAEAFIRDLHRKHRAFSYHTDERRLTEPLLSRLKKNRIRVFAYTVNDVKRMDELIRWGVTGIITNEPAQMQQLLAEKQLL